MHVHIYINRKKTLKNKFDFFFLIFCLEEKKRKKKKTFLTWHCLPRQNFFTL
jgi:hypothetical protein